MTQLFGSFGHAGSTSNTGTGLAAPPCACTLRVGSVATAAAMPMPAETRTRFRQVDRFIEPPPSEGYEKEQRRNPWLLHPPACQSRTLALESGVVLASLAPPRSGGKRNQDYKKE